MKNLCIGNLYFLLVFLVFSDAYGMRGSRCFDFIIFYWCFSFCKDWDLILWTIADAEVYLGRKFSTLTALLIINWKNRRTTVKWLNFIMCKNAQILIYILKIKKKKAGESWCTKRCRHLRIGRWDAQLHMQIILK